MQTCPTCQTENDPQARFCQSCGARLAQTCPQCGSSLPAQARFCAQCGAAAAAPAAPPPPPASPPMASVLERLIPREYAARLLRSVGERPANERRLVTILFSDIKGSTALAEHMDPEDVLEIINGAFEALIAPIYRREGTLARLMGDAILAFFGAPVAHEDDPQRAVRAALEIQAGVQEYARELARQRDIQGFNVRVGINTGLVIVGEVGSDLRVEYTAIGDAINTAARMEQNAPVGGVLISHATYQHVRGLFELEAQPPLMVKGKSEPMQTYLVLGLRSQASASLRAPERGLEGVQTPLIGRDSELLWLNNQFQDAIQEAQTRLITVVGDAGVGKSRLLDEFIQRYASQTTELCTLVGRGAPDQRQRSFGVLRSLFAAYLGIQENDRAAQVSERFQQGLAPDLLPAQAGLVGQLLGYEIAGAAASGGSLENQALDCLEDYFRSLSARQRLLVILDDIHWADDASLDFVDRLVNRLPERRLLVLCLARPALYETRPHWGEGRECYERLDLRPLSRHSTRQLIGHLLTQATNLPPQLEDLLLKNAEGNPYYTEELARMCLEMLARAQASGQPAGAELLERVPSTLTGVLQARLETLSPSEKTLLQQAAVVGREFWDDLLADLTLSGPEQDAEALAKILETLRSRAMVARRERSSFPGAFEYTFKHAVLQETVYETVLLKQRRQYHARVAAWLEAHAGDRQAEYWPRIAMHYERAGEPERAADFWQKAADNASAKKISREAESAYQRVLDLLPPDAPDLDPALRLRRAQALLDMGWVKLDLNLDSEALVRLEECIRLTAACPGAAALTIRSGAHYCLGVLYFFVLDKHQQGMEQTGLALQYARQSGNVLDIAQAISLRGIMLVFQNQLATAEALFLESAIYYRQYIPTESRQSDYYRILLILYRLALQRGEEAQTQAFAAELLELARRTPGGLDSPHALTIRFTLALTSAQDIEAEHLARQRLRLAHESGDRGQFFESSGDLILACLMQGRTAEAEQSARQALEQAHIWQNEREEMNFMRRLAQVAQARQEWAAGQAWLEQAMEVNQRRAKGDPLALDVSVMAYAGHFYAAQGDWPQAREYFHRCLVAPFLENDAIDLLRILLEMAEALARLGERELLAELIGVLDGIPLLYTPQNQRQYIAPLQDGLDLKEPGLAAAYQRGQEHGLAPLRQRLIELCAPPNSKPA